MSWSSFFNDAPQAAFGPRAAANNLGSFYATSRPVESGTTYSPTGTLKKAYKNDVGKPRFDLIDPQFLEDLARVLTIGSGKYDESELVYENNWRQSGMRWGRVFGACMRHLWAFWRGEDKDEETGISHLAHATACIMFLSNYSRRYMGLDDRDHGWRETVRIGLDLDGVLVDWSGAIHKRILEERPDVRIEGEAGGPIWWNWMDRSVLAGLFTDEEYADFLATVPESLVNPSELNFEPAAYITHRGIPDEATRAWLSSRGFPHAPLVSVSDSRHKVEAAKDLRIDVFVEDKFETFVQMNNAGILCFLMDQPVNRRHNVGDRRITHLNQIMERFTS